MFLLPSQGSNFCGGQHSRRIADCAGRRKCLINKARRRKGPGGPTGLQNAFGSFSYVMSGYAVSKVARFSAADIMLGYAVEAGSGH